MLIWQRWGKSTLTKSRVLLSEHTTLHAAIAAIPATIRIPEMKQKAEAPYVVDYIHEAIELALFPSDSIHYQDTSTL